MKSFPRLQIFYRYPSFVTVVIFLLMITVYIWSLQGLKVDFHLLKDSWPFITDFISRLFPPNLQVLDIAVQALIETVQMSVWG
ncbi:MAG: phosphonate ABC transporter, permease protein PhnE, partial [Dolichospermum sp.]